MSFTIYVYMTGQLFNSIDLTYELAVDFRYQTKPIINENLPE